MKNLTGTGVALVTPFTSDGSIDYPSLKKVLRHTARGADYYVVMGTTGESVTLSQQEKQAVLKYVIANNAKNLPIVYGIGSNDTAHAIREMKSTDLKGVDAILSVNPYYNKPSQEGIYMHFKAIADASRLPIILYNVPGRTASNITADTTLRLARHKRIIGVKEASGNLEQCMRIARDKPEDFLLISGDDMQTLPLYSIGGEGVISVLANAFPLAFRKMKEEAAAGNYSKATEHVFSILDLNPLMYEEGNPVGVKYVMSLMGLCEPHTRLPHAPASVALTNKIKSVFRQLKKG